MSKLFCVLATVFLAAGLIARGEENLLRNPDMESVPDKPGVITDWEMDQGWTKGDIPSFQGFPFKMIYLARENGGQLWQDNIPVATNTMYVLEAWYRGDLAPARNSGNFWLYVCQPTEPGDGKDFGARYLQRFAGSIYGAIGDWTKRRVYFNSGNHKRVGVLARVSGEGKSAVGRLSLRPVSDNDLQGPWLQDGGFENGISGKAPLEFGVGRDVVVTDQEAFRGKHCAVLKVPEKNTLSLSALIPAQPGDKLIFSFMAKTAGPEIVIKPRLLRTGGTAVGGKWKKVEVEATVSDGETRSAKDFVAGIQVFGCRIGFENAPAGTEVWIDEMDIRVERKDAAADKQPVFGTPKNPLKNSSFEAGLDGWEPRFRQIASDDGWPLKFGAAEIDETTSVEGRRSLRITNPRKEQGEANAGLMSFYFPVAEDRTYTISFWAKTDTTNTAVEVSLFQYSRRNSEKVTLDSSEWKRYSVKMKPSCLNEGFNYLRFDFPSATNDPTRPTTYWLDAVQVEAGDQMSAYTPAGDIEIGADFVRTYPWYRVGEQPEIKVSYCSRFPDDRKMTLSWIVSDWRKRIMDRGEKEVALPAGKSRSEILPMYNRSLGAFRVAVALADPKSGLKMETATVYGIFPQVRAVPAERSCMGIHLSFIYGAASKLPDGTRLKKAYVVLPGGTLEDALALPGMIGARWEREFTICEWSITQPQETRWIWFDHWVDALRAKGIRIMPMLGWTIENKPYSIPKWCLADQPVAADGAGRMSGATPNRLPRLDAWKTYVRTVTEHYGDRVAALELWNETGALPAQDYAVYAKAAREAIKDIKNRPLLVGPGYPSQGLPWGDNDDTWIGKAFKAGFYPYVDVLSAHYYPPGGNYGGNADFEGLTDRYGNRAESLHNQLNYVWKTYGKKPLWDTESGVLGRSQVRAWEQPSNPFNVHSASPEQQAQRFVRWQVIRMAAGFERFFWHVLSFICSPVGSQYHELCEPNLAPKPVTVAHAQFARRLDDFVFHTKVEITPTIWAYVFVADNKTVGIYWNYAAEQDGEIRFPLDPAGVIAEDLMGNPLEPQPTAGSIELPLGLNPVYLVSEKLSPGQMAEAFRQAAPRGVKAVEPAIGLSDGPALAVGVKNIVTWPVSGGIALQKLPEKWETDGNSASFALEKGANFVKIFPLKAFRVEGGEAAITAVYEGQTNAKSLVFYLAEAKQAQVTIDGEVSPEEYGGAPCVVLNDASQVPPSTDRKTGMMVESVWGGKEKGSAEIYAAWRPDILYFGIKVKDDVVLNDAPDDRLWSQDSVEIHFDTAPAGNLFQKNTFSEEQGRLTVAPPDKDGRVRYKVELTPGGKPRHFDIANAQFMGKISADGYTVEIALPTRDLTLKPGKALGFFADLNDIDAKDGGKRTLLWRQVGNNKFYSDNSLWGYLLLK